jgi:hypothetical protein
MPLLAPHYVRCLLLDECVIVLLAPHYVRCLLLVECVIVVQKDQILSRVELGVGAAHAARAERLLKQSGMERLWKPW